MKSTRGFTVVELIIVIALFAVASIVFFIQKNDFETSSRDDARKTSINALYYSLEEVYYPNNGSYPRALNAETLPSVDPELFSDPFGVDINQGESNFRYEPLDCTEDSCKSYTLRSILENESDFIKESRQ